MPSLKCDIDLEAAAGLEQACRWLKTLVLTKISREIGMPGLTNLGVAVYLSPCCPAVVKILVFQPRMSSKRSEQAFSVRRCNSRTPDVVGADANRGRR